METVAVVAAAASAGKPACSRQPNNLQVINTALQKLPCLLEGRLSIESIGWRAVAHLQSVSARTMTTQSFENLDFSILVEVENNLAFLQRWEDGVWGEPYRFTTPLSSEDLKQIPVLAQTLKSFRRDPQSDALRDALTHRAWRLTSEEPGRLARFWAFIQAPFRQLAPEPRQ